MTIVKSLLECNPGTFGNGCTGRCSGNCLNNEVCHHIDGACTGGCINGYIGKLCSIGNFALR